MSCKTIIITHIDFSQGNRHLDKTSILLVQLEHRDEDRNRTFFESFVEAEMPPHGCPLVTTTTATEAAIEGANRAPIERPGQSMSRMSLQSVPLRSTKAKTKAPKIEMQNLWKRLHR